MSVSRDTGKACRFHELLVSERRSAAVCSGLAATAHGDQQNVLIEPAALERKHAEIGEPVSTLSANALPRRWRCWPVAEGDLEPRQPVNRCTSADLEAAAPSNSDKPGVDATTKIIFLTRLQLGFVTPQAQARYRATGRVAMLKT
jgi:hypothetical protein